MADIFDFAVKSSTAAVRLFPVNILDVPIKYIPMYFVPIYLCIYIYYIYLYMYMRMYTGSSKKMVGKLNRYNFCSMPDWKFYPSSFWRGNLYVLLICILSPSAKFLIKVLAYIYLVHERWRGDAYQSNSVSLSWSLW